MAQRLTVRSDLKNRREEQCCVVGGKTVLTVGRRVIADIHQEENR